MKILVIQKKMMGDVLVSSIVFELLKKYYPNAELHYLIDKKHYQVIKNHRYIDKVIYFESFFSMLKRIRKGRYNVVIDIYAKMETAILSFLSGAEKRISFYKEYTALFYTETVRRTRKEEFPLLTTALEHRLRLLAPLNIKIEPIKPKIFISEEEEKDAYNLLENLGVINNNLLMISTFGSCPEKTYPIEYMAEIIDFIAENTTAKILCNYLPSQKVDFETLYNLLSENTKNQIIKDFDTKNLRQYIAVLSYCKALIGNEGGSTNISKAMDIPTFSIYAPGIEGWDWYVDGVKNISIHAKNYQINSYQEYKPNLFKEELLQFLENNKI